MNQHSPNPGLALGWPSSFGPTSFNRVRPLPRMTTHWLRWYWAPGLAPCKEWWWGEVAFSRWFLNKPQWRAQDKDTEETQKVQISRTDLMKPEGDFQPRYFIWWYLDDGLAQMAMEDSRLDGSTGREIE